MTVFRQSHSQQMRTWGYATATLRRNCACGAGKGRMRAGRLTWQRQEKPTCAQVALISESLQVNRNNERNLCAKRKLKQGGYLCSCLTMRPTSRPTLNACKCMNFNETSHRPTSGNFLPFTNRASVQALRLYACVHNHIFTIPIQGRTVGHKGNTENQLATMSGDPGHLNPLRAKDRGLFLGIENRGLPNSSLDFRLKIKAQQNDGILTP